jgi:hypothetical protein
VISAAKTYGCRAVGVELRPELVARARENVVRAGVEGLVEIREGDIFAADFRDATVVALYLLPELNLRLIPELNRLRPGSRVVSYRFDMPGVPTKQTLKWEIRGIDQTVHLWITPIRPPDD